MLIGTYNAQFIGDTMCGFENKHEYLIKIDKDLYGYQVSSLYDITDQDNSSTYISYASENSLKRYWIIKEDTSDTNINKV